MGAQQSQSGDIPNQAPFNFSRTRSLDENGSAPTSSAQIIRHRRPSDSSTISSSSKRSQRDLRSRSTLVVVNRPSSTSDFTFCLEDEDLYKKLEELPMFVPLMHEVDTASKIFGIGVRNRALEEIRSKITPTPFIHIIRLYTERVRSHGEVIRGEQKRLSAEVKDVDAKVASIFKGLTERQKKFAKHIEHLGKLQDITHTLSKCTQVLRTCERNLQILNGLLPIEERLEPFSWPDLFDDQGQEGVECTDNLDGGFIGRVRYYSGSSGYLDFSKSKEDEQSDDSVEIADEQSLTNLSGQ